LSHPGMGPQHALYSIFGNIQVKFIYFRKLTVYLDRRISNTQETPAVAMSSPEMTNVNRDQGNVKM
jgi:hypothetical protein